MENQKIINKTKNFVRKRLLEDASGHDWWHSYRVWKIGKKLATEEKANVFLVELMCLLHDIADYKLNNGDEMIGLKLLFLPDRKYLRLQQFFDMAYRQTSQYYLNLY